MEKNRIAEQERQRREEEWERTRVQREAQQREEILREAQRRAEQDRADRERREQEERQAVEDKKSAVMPDSKCCALCIGPHAKLAPVPATMKAA